MELLRTDKIAAWVIPGIKRCLMEDSSKSVIDIISGYFDVPLAKITSRFRGQEKVVYARDFIIWFLIRRTTLNLREIGNLIGGRDHTTVIHARQKVSDRLYKDKSGQFEQYRIDHKALIDLIENIDK